jgi:hypothetical protein
LARNAGSALGWQGLAAGDTEAVEGVDDGDRPCDDPVLILGEDPRGLLASFPVPAGAEPRLPGEYRSTVRKLGLAAHTEVKH